MNKGLQDAVRQCLENANWEYNKALTDLERVVKENSTLLDAVVSMTFADMGRSQKLRHEGKKPSPPPDHDETQSGLRLRDSASAELHDSFHFEPGERSPIKLGAFG